MPRGSEGCFNKRSEQSQDPPHKAAGTQPAAQGNAVAQLPPPRLGPHAVGVAPGARGGGRAALSPAPVNRGVSTGSCPRHCCSLTGAGGMPTASCAPAVSRKSGLLRARDSVRRGTGDTDHVFVAAIVFIYEANAQRVCGRPLPITRLRFKVTYGK